MNNSIICGLDVGYFDTKTQHTISPSGFSFYQSLPFMQGNDLLTYNGKFYIPEDVRISHAMDKKTDETLAVLSMIGIAKEIKNSFHGNNHRATQEDISQVKILNLGIGLPPGNFQFEKEPMVNYYYELFKDGLQFTYEGLEYKLSLGCLETFPQDYSAAITYENPNGDKTIARTYKDYIAIDIGGHTVDIVPVINGKPYTKGCTSLPMGIIHMFDEIKTNVRNEKNMNLTHRHIEMVLRGEKAGVPEDVQSLISNGAKAWANKILTEIKQLGYDFRVTPSVFIGGGTKLLKVYISEYPELNVHEFITDPRANAAGYAKLLEIKLKMR